MGAYSTVSITKEDAIKEILAALDEATDEELADALFALKRERTLYNYRIVDNYNVADTNQAKHDPIIDLL
jgi:hypothetical protein